MSSEAVCTTVDCHFKSVTVCLLVGEKPELDHNPPIMQHNSRGRSTSSCNCGRKQAPREDPFDIQAANYDFYQVSENCTDLLITLDYFL